MRTTLTALLVTGLSLLTHGMGSAAAKPAGQNREPLKPQPYLRLPLGSVQAKSWLKHQLELQRDGLTGHAEELYNDIGESDWISDQKRGGQHAWERGPYYAKGLIALAFVLNDDELKAKSRKWVDKIIESQRENGDFGPKDRNWWPNMIVLHYLRDYFEATGDEQILPFMERYFQFELKSLPSHPLHKESGWAKARGGDNLEIVLWLYNRTGEAWLLDLAKLLIQQTNQWHKFYAGQGGDNWYPDHIVNVMQGMKTPPLMYLVSADDAYQTAFAKATRSDSWLMKRYGRIDDMFNGTEPLTDRSSTGGTEMCAIVERILSNTVAIKILGDAYIGDQLERIGYNALPADLTPTVKGLRYYVLPNQPKSTNEKLGFKHNGNGQNSICPSPHSGYACCRSNFHHGWPKFVHNMWMATADNGLAIAAYGPNTVTANVGQAGIPVTIDQATDYPFKTDVTLKVEATEPVAFPLELRIPGWCAKPAVTLNGEPIDALQPGTFHRIERTWKAGDTVTLRFPMQPTTSRWINDSIAVTRGPLVFALLIEEEPWKSTQTFLDGEFHTYEIRPKSDWNYALLLKDPDNPLIEVAVAEEMPAQPFKATDAPVHLTLRGFRTDAGGWGTYRNDFPARAVDPPKSPVERSGEVEVITLIPYGAAQCRITYFPWATRK